MSESIAEDFERRVQNNGVKLKNVPNTIFEESEFSFSDYVSKDPGSWAYVPENPEGVDVESVAEEMYEVYQSLEEAADEVTLNRSEDDMYWAEVSVDIPEDPSRRERVAELVAESLIQRQQL